MYWQTTPAQLSAARRQSETAAARESHRSYRGCYTWFTYSNFRQQTGVGVLPPEGVFDCSSRKAAWHSRWRASI